MQNTDTHQADNPGLPEGVVNSVHEGVVHTLNSICGSEPTFTGGPAGAPGVAIAGIIPLTLVADATISWSMVLGFPAKTEGVLRVDVAGGQVSGGADVAAS